MVVMMVVAVTVECGGGCGKYDGGSSHCGVW